MTVKGEAETNPELRCTATSRDRHWLYRIGEEGIIYSQAQNRFAGLDAAGVLAYQAFDAGASPHDLQGFSTADHASMTAGALNAIFTLSQGKFPRDPNIEESGDWPALETARNASIEVHGVPLLVEPPYDAPGILCKDCFLSCSSTTRAARFHVSVRPAGTLWSVSINGKEVFSSIRDEQIGLGLLHAVRSLLYAEAQYDIAFHAAMLANTQHGIMLCAPRESGKSTLAAWMAAHDYTLVSDEPALLNLSTESISPVEMPLSLKEGTWSLLETVWPRLAAAPVHVRSDGKKIKFLHPPSDRVTHAPHRLTHIVIPSYSPSSPPRLEALAPLRALTVLNASGMLLGKELDKDKFESLLKLICSTPTFIAHYSSLQQADRMIQNILEERTSSPG